ncbi:putative glycolipid-binding domain-containing protein [Streptomyces sp. SBT349]|uniref:putative glycolipid-binding domain-containing protein n=1 Tax=Streptomyces sp. SBT349 TaxID=1580539 RepID=UPI00066D1738|nr:putative glycolipid-binding domain-containing protein [Streptomyces sp. SBT349]
MTSAFAAPPRSAAWAHQEARSGFEVVHFHGDDGGGHAIEGCTTAVEEGDAWVVEYRITVDASWRTRTARVTGTSEAGRRSTELRGDGEGHWLVDGEAAPHLDGCFDVDLESSAMTNAFPVHRMALPVGGQGRAPAAYVRALGLGVERLEQGYARTADEGGHQRYDYEAPVFDVACRLVYDGSGLVLAYPGIAIRAA